MPIHFIDNYPKNNLESVIAKADGSPLYGEIWFYQELVRFNENNFLRDETWYLKHNYNLSSHPGSTSKVEGQIDFLVLNKYGVLIVEIKGGGIEVDENDIYYSYETKDKSKRYESQNPFNQVKEYVHSLRSLVSSTPYIYRAVIFPHEAGFDLRSPQLKGYNYLFFCKRHTDAVESPEAKNRLLFDFLTKLPKESRKNLLVQLDPLVHRDNLDEKIWRTFPILEKSEIKRLKSELFPVQNSYGFDPDRIRDEIILEQNFEILKGLERNRKVLVQGAPGTGKTVLATKFLASQLLKQQKGICFCANKLLRAKMEHLVCNELRLDPNSVAFRIYYEGIDPESISAELDFIIVDEAQEFFDKGLFDFAEKVDSHFGRPKWLMLYDPEQSIVSDYKEIDWYANYFLESSYVHYLFDTFWRGCQNKAIADIAQLIRNGQSKRLLHDHSNLFVSVNTLPEKLASIKHILDTALPERAKNIILIHSDLIEAFKEVASDFFKNDLIELTDSNINLKDQKCRYTTPIKYRGLEAENVILITHEFNDKTRVQNYVGVTRAIYNLKFIIWK